MLQFLLKRILSGAAMILAIAVLAFGMLAFVARNAARAILGPNASEAQVELKTQELGLDRSVFEQFGSWLGGAITGDLGTSWFTSQPVTDLIAVRLPVTLSIIGFTMLVSMLIAFALGMLAGVRRGWVDRAMQVLTTTGHIVPGFIVALVLVTTIAIGLGWFPATGYTAFAKDPGKWASSLVLPVAALAFGGVAAVAQQVRRSVIDVLAQEHLRTSRSRGVPEWVILSTNVLKNVSAPGITVLALLAVGLLGGTVIVEQIFALPGLGTMAIQEASRGDVPSVMGLVITTSIIVVVINLVVDLIVGLLNPKARLS